MRRVRAPLYGGDALALLAWRDQARLVREDDRLHTIAKSEFVQWFSLLMMGASALSVWRSM